MISFVANPHRIPMHIIYCLCFLVGGCGVDLLRRSFPNIELANFYNMYALGGKSGWCVLFVCVCVCVVLALISVLPNTMGRRRRCRRSIRDRVRASRCHARLPTSEKGLHTRVHAIIYDTQRDCWYK